MTTHDDGRREVIWRGLDDPTRLDVASVEFGGSGGLVATGTQSTDEYRARWDLIVDASWCTRMLTVDVEGRRADDDSTPVPPWQRHLNLWRRDGVSASEWRLEGGESGDVPRHFGEIGMAKERLSLLTDAVDVDLSGCPLTNIMPIRRLGLSRGSGTECPITTAWVSLPELTVRPASQIYAPAAEGLSEIASALDDDVAAVVHYTSATRNVSVDLSLDSDGLVLTYPDLAARITSD